MSDHQPDPLGEARARGLVKDCTDADGLAALLGEGPITAYAGFDPTAGSLHVGHLVPLMLLRLLARHGHAPIAVVGGITAQIGDPSGRRTERSLLAADTVRANVQAIGAQLRGLLGGDSAILDNRAWLQGRDAVDFLRDLGPHVPVSRLLASETVSSRLDAGTGLSFLEFAYPLFQAADFLELHRSHDCRLQIGGSDQWGNITVGADVVRRVTGRRVFGLTQPLVTTASGAKMGKTADGAVWLDPELTDDHAFFQFWRDCDDADVGRFLRLFTDLPLSEIAELESRTGAGLNAAKKRLAHEVTALVRGPEAAARAQAAAEAVFEGAGDDAGLPEIDLDRTRLASDGIPLAELLHDASLAPSRSAARRLLSQGGVRLAGRKVDDPARALTAADLADGRLRLSAGKRRHVMLRVAS